MYASDTTGASADGNYVPNAPFVLLNHNLPANVPIQNYPTGGLFSTTPINNSPIAQYMYIPFSALAAGLAISPDGTTLFVANYQNDSLSVDRHFNSSLSLMKFTSSCRGRPRRLAKCLTGPWWYRMLRALR